MRAETEMYASFLCNTIVCFAMSTWEKNQFPLSVWVRILYTY